MRQELARQFCWRPNQIRSLCDAAAFLLDEIGAGMARGVRRAVGITMGAGIGLVRAVDGRAVTEWPGFPPGGEMWNLPCSGRQVEDFISSRAIQNH
jgi:glucokinase